MARLKQHIVSGTEGDDLIDGTWPHRSSPNGAEIILGRGGNDAIFGLGGNDFIDAGSGNDTVKGGKGNDAYTGGSGSDRYVYDPGDGVDTLVETKNQPGVVDSVLVSGALIDMGWAFDGNDLLIYAPRDPLDVLDPANHIRVVNQYAPGGGGIEFFEADTGENNSFYTDQSVVPGGIARVYTPTGTTGTDQGPYFELIVGTSKSETLVGGGGFRDQFNAGAGNDRVIGSDETADRLFGGAGDDTLLGFGGSDRFRGQQGNDLMNGGDGNDHVQYIGVLTGSADAVHVDLNLQGVPQFISADQGWDTLISIENITGSNFNDTLIGDEGGNFLAGGFDPPYPDGDDLILGRGGNDGLAGADGNDTLVGGTGADNLSGGGDADVFRYTELGDGVLDGDWINDLQTGSGGDAIDLADVLDGYDPNTSVVSDFVNLVDLGDGNSLLQADPDGSGPAGFTDIAVLAGINGLSAQDLYDGGNLIVSNAAA